MQHAYFDADGICTSVADIEMPIPQGGCARLVPGRIDPRAIWLDGDTLRPTAPCTVAFPDALEQAEADYSLDLPHGVIATVDGVRQRGQLKLSLREERDFHVVVCGAMHGGYVVQVASYATRRRQAYPAIGDQLDALWKTVEALRDASPSVPVAQEAVAILDEIAAIKDANPKDGPA